MELSTPHGALGTRLSKRTVYSYIEFLSTPYGALGTEGELSLKGTCRDLSTPYGALGTLQRSEKLIYAWSTFNSIRCIRNGALFLSLKSSSLLFQLHTVH